MAMDDGGRSDCPVAAVPLPGSVLPYSRLIVEDDADTDGPSNMVRELNLSFDASEFRFGEASMTAERYPPVELTRGAGHARGEGWRVLCEMEVGSTKA